jgi:hypothetical protein
MSHAPIKPRRGEGETRRIIQGSSCLRVSVSPCLRVSVSPRLRISASPHLRISASVLGAQGRTQTFNLWFVGPALRQLSYSGLSARWTFVETGTQPWSSFLRGVSASPSLRSRVSVSPCLVFWWSELELNQPLGFFKPTLIHLSYPTRDIADCQLTIADWLRIPGFRN